MEIEQLFGLPAHPLVVHGAVVLVPLAGLAALLLLVPRVRTSRFPQVVLALAVVAFGAALLAKETGEAFLDRDELAGNPALRDHQALGDTLPLVVAALVVLALAVVVVERRQRRQWGARRSTAVPAALALLAAVAGGASVVQVARTGHAGATSVWGDEADDDAGEDAADAADDARDAAEDAADDARDAAEDAADG